jgi:hypothetical protein
VTGGASGPRATEIDAHPESRVQNSQPHGIGRVALLDGVVAWNNLGRNVVFAGEDLRPRAVYDESAFAEDEPSQYDLDVHAILEPAGTALIVTLNHFGTARAFDVAAIRRPGPLRRVAPVWTRSFVADVERAAVVGDRLIGSRPRETRSPGLLVSEPVGRNGTGADLDVSVALEQWGSVTALAAMGGDGVVLGGERRVAAASLTEGAVGELRWEAQVDFEPAFLSCAGGLVWTAGSETGAVDDYDWEAQHGGGFVALDQVDGRVVLGGRFEHDLAWGNGGVALALVPGALCGFGRRGEVHVFDARDGTLVGIGAPIADASLGLAHATADAHHLVFGYNRGGYRLHAVPVSAVRRLLP